MINPEQLEWTWTARNLRLRETLVVGSPRSDAECPSGLRVEDINIIRMAAEKAECMPRDCKSVLGNILGGEDGQTAVVRLEWSWKSVRKPDEAFGMILQVLQTRFLAGLSELARAMKSASGSLNGVAVGAEENGAGGERPPTGARRGTKRFPEEDLVVPVYTSVRRMRHPKMAAKFVKTLAAAPDLLVDEE